MSIPNILLSLGYISFVGWFLFRRVPEIGPGATIPPGAPKSVTRWRQDALDAGRTYGVSPQLVLAVIWQESDGVPSATGSAREKGLMQVKDVAARDAGWGASTYEPRANIFIGTSYLALQIERMGDVFDGVRAYNAGEAGARRGNGYAYAESVFRRAGWT